MPLKWELCIKIRKRLGGWRVNPDVIDATGAVNGQFDSVMQPATLVALPTYTIGPPGDLSLTVSAIGTINQWINPGNGAFDVGGNWSLGVPNAAHDTIIGIGAVTVTHGLVVADTVASLSLVGSSTFALAAGSLTINTDSILDGNLSISGGAILLGAGDVTVNGTFTANSGNVTGTGSEKLSTNGTSNINGPFGLNTRPWDNFGTANWTAGDITLALGASSILTNEAGAIFNINTASANNDLNGAGSFVNEGTVNKNSNLRTDFNVSVTNNAAFNVTTNEVRLQRNSTNTGTLTVDGTLTIDSGGTLNLNASTVVAGSGLINVTGFDILSVNVPVAMATGLTLTVDGTIANAQNLTIPDTFILNSGSVTGTGTFTTPATSTTTLSGLPKTLGAGLAWNSLGLVNWTAGDFVLTDAGSVFTVGSGAPSIFNINTASANDDMNGAGSFVNDGTVNKNSNLRTDFNVSVTNNAAFNVITNEVKLQRTSANTGTLSVDGMLTIDASATLNLNAGTAVAGSGLLNVANFETLSVNVPVAMAAGLTLTVDGTIANAQNLTIPNTFNLNSGSVTGTGTFTTPAMSTTTLSGLPKTLGAGLAWNSLGLVNWTAGDFVLTDAGSVFTVGAGALSIFNINTGSSNDDMNGSGTIVNNGTLNKISGVNTVFNVAFTNTGTVDVQAGVLDYNFGNNQTAGITQLTGGSLDSTGNININGGLLQGSGTVLRPVIINAGGALGPGLSIGTMNVTGNVTFNSGGAFNVELENGASDVLDASGFTVTIQPGAILNLTSSGGPTPIGGEMFNVILGSSVVNTFTVVNQPAGFNLAQALIGGNTLELTVTGVINTWVGGSGSLWTTGVNWSLGVPTMGHDVRINLLNEFVNLNTGATEQIASILITNNVELQVAGNSTLQLDNASLLGDGVNGGKIILLSGSLGGVGPLTIDTDGVLALNNGTILAPTNVVNNGLVEFTNGLNTVNGPLSGIGQVTAINASVATINLANTLQTVTTSGGNIDFKANTSIDTFNIQGAGNNFASDPAVSVTVTNVANWSNGFITNLQGSLDIDPLATLNITAAVATDNGGTINNAGMTNLSGGTFALGDSAGTFNNLLGADFNILDDSDITIFNGAFNNNSGATLSKTGGGLDSVISGSAFNNSGTVVVASGKLSIQTVTGAHGSLFNVSNAAAELELTTGAHTFNGPANFMGPGVTRLVAGTWNLNNDVNVNSGHTFIWEGGTMNGPNTFTVDATATLEFDQPAIPTLNTLLVNNGFIDVISSPANPMGASGEIRNQGVMEMQGGGFSGATGTFHNTATGTIQKTIGPAVGVNILMPVMNDGTITVDAGTLGIRSPSSTHSATAIINANATDNFFAMNFGDSTPTGHSFAPGVTFNGAGAVLFNSIVGNTIFMNGVTANADVINQAALTSTNNTFNGSLDNQGTMVVATNSTTNVFGALTTGGASLIQIDSVGGNGNGVFIVDNGFTNNGTILYNNAGNVPSMTVTMGTLTNNGTIQTVGGTANSLTAAVTNTASGLFNTDSNLTVFNTGKTFDVQLGTLDIDLTNTASGLFNTDSNLTVFNTGKTFDVQLGTLDIANGVTLAVNDGATVLGTGTTLLQTGTVRLNGAHALTLASDFTNVAGGVVLLPAGTVTVGGAGSFTNLGVFTGGFSNIWNVNVDNQGSWTIPTNTTTNVFGTLTTNEPSQIQLDSAGGNGNAIFIVDNGFTNNGTILYNNAGNVPSMTVSMGTLTNNGTIQTVGGTANSLTANVTNMASGLFNIDSNLTVFNTGKMFDVQLGTLDIAGGVILAVSNGTTVLGTGTNLLQTGTLRLDGAHALTLASDFTHPAAGVVLSPAGTVTVGGAGSFTNLGVLTGGPNNTWNVNVDNQGMWRIPTLTTTNVFGTLTTSGPSQIQLDSAGGNGNAVFIVDNSFTNNGTILYNNAGNTPSLTVSMGTLTNNGTIQTMGGTANSLTANVTNTAAGVFNLDSNLTVFDTSKIFDVQLGMLDIAGGVTLAVSNGTTVLGTGTTLLQTGTLRLDGAHALTLASDFTHPAAGVVLSPAGTVTVGGAGSFTNQGVLTGGPNNTWNVNVDNQGMWRIPTLTTTNVFGTLTTSGPSQIQLDSVSGNGNGVFTVANSFINNGTILYNNAGNTPVMTVSAGTLTNSSTGLIQASGGATNNLVGTVLNQGTIDLNGNGLNFTGPAALTNDTGGFIIGDGTLTAAGGVDNNGTISVGASPGLMAILGNVAFNSGSTFLVELATGLVSDVLNVTGTVTINPGATLTIAGFAGYTGVALDNFTGVIASTGALNGAFTTINQDPSFNVAPTYTVGGPGDLSLLVAGTSNIWIGPLAGGLWSVPANWSLTTLPVAVDDVLFNTAANVNQDIGGTINSISTIAGSTLTSSGGTLTINTDSALSGNLDISGGTLTGPGNITVTGLTRWIGNNTTVDGAGILYANSGFDINAGGGTNRTLGRLVEVGSPSTWTNSIASTILNGGGGIIRNLGGNTITATNTGDFNFNPTLDNLGTFTQTGSGTFNVIGALTNNNTINANGGKTAINSNSTVTGMFNIGTGGILAVTSGTTVFDGASSITGTGGGGGGGARGEL